MDQFQLRKQFGIYHKYRCFISKQPKIATLSYIPPWLWSEIDATKRTRRTKPFDSLASYVTTQPSWIALVATPKGPLVSEYFMGFESIFWQPVLFSFVILQNILYLNFTYNEDTNNPTFATYITKQFLKEIRYNFYFIIHSITFLTHIWKY